MGTGAIHHLRLLTSTHHHQKKHSHELVIGCYDSRILILSESREIILKKADESALSAQELQVCSMKKRLSWSVGTGSVWPVAICVDQNCHRQGYRLFVAVNSELVAYDYESGAQLFRTTCRAKILSLDIRHDVPSLVAGNQANEVVIYSARQGSIGKVQDTLHGHDAAVECVRIDHHSKICYSLDKTSDLCCWNIDRHVLLHRQNISHAANSNEERKKYSSGYSRKKTKK